MVMSRWGSLAFRQSCTAAGREALAMLRQATLIHRDVRSSPGGVPSLEQRTDLVILLHGLFATAGVLRPLRERIEAEADCLTVSFTYAPGTGVAELANRIDALIEQVPGRPRIHLVGHSLGGVAVRWYVQEKQLDTRVVQTISLASPFAGSRHARLLPSVAGELVPGSALLRRIHEMAAQIDLPHLSIAGANDLMVEPCAWLNCGDRRIFPALGHNGLLYDPDVISTVVQRIRLVVDERSEDRTSNVRPIATWVSREDLEERLSEPVGRVSSAR